MTLTHPNATRDVPTPAAVTGPDGETYPIDGDGAVDCPPDVEEDVADALADAHDVDVEDLLEESTATCDELVEGEVCGRELPCQYHSDDED